MKKKITIILLICSIIINIILGALYFNEKNSVKKHEVLFNYSASFARERLLEFQQNESQSDFTYAVCNINSMNYALGFLKTTGMETLDFNELYGLMVLDPYKFKIYTSDICEILELLEQDYNDPNAYSKLRIMLNEIKYS